MNAFFLITLAAAVSMLVIPFAWRLAPRLGLVDQPDARKVHVTPIPRVGGWGIAAGLVTPLLLVKGLDPVLLSFVVGVLTLFLFGLWDDAREIGHWPKFIGQIFAAGVVVYYGDLYVSRLPFFDSLVLDPSFGKPFTVFALVGAINAINHSDGLDGLAGGETMLSFLAIAFLGFQTGSTLVVDIALATIGGTIGFLRYNTHPARVFMGDCGSQVLGYTVGFLVVYLTQVANTAISPALPLLLLGLPIADIVAVLYLRARNGLNWFKATRNHVHHRLLDLGFEHYETVVIIYSVQALMVVGAVFLRYESDGLIIATYALVITGVFAGLALAERRGWRVHRHTDRSSYRLSAFVDRLTASTQVRETTLGFIACGVAGALVIGATGSRVAPADMGIGACILIAVILFEGLRRPGLDSPWLRGALYVTTAFCTYLFIHYPRPEAAMVEHIASAVVIALALAIAIYIRFLSVQKFGTTPTDYLIVFGIIAFAVFGNLDVRAGPTAQFLTYLIVLFYGCEVIAGQAVRWRRLLTSAAVVALVAIALHAFLLAPTS